MPLYEYECDNNGHRFEVIQKFSDPPIAVCPKCGGPVHKMISSPAFQFKGSGWYITDYARKDAGGKPEGESTDKAASKESKDAKESKESKESTTSDKDGSSKKSESTTTSSKTETKNST